MSIGEVGNLRTRVSMDTSEFQRGAQQVNRELRLMKSESKLARTEMHSMGGTMNTQKGYLGALTNEEKGLREAIAMNRQEYEKYRREAELSGKATEGNTAKMASAGNKLIKNEQNLARVRAEMDRMNREILQQESGWFQAGEAMQRAGGKIEGFGRGMNTAANHLMKLSAVTAAVGGYFIKAAIDWESSVATMHKTISGTPQEMRNVKDSIREMALEVPLAAHELAELAAIAGQLGIETENIPGFTRVIADLAVATNITGEAGAQMLAQFGNITQMDQGDYDRLGSTIALLGNNTAATEAPILEMSQLLAGAGHAAGLSQPEIVGIAAGLASLGISAERGGSSFSKLMVYMAVAAETGLEPLRQLEEASGLTRRELELLQSNDSRAFRDLADGLGMTTGEMRKMIEAGNDLEGYAQVAGMSAEEFARAFGEDAAGAIGLFIDGLAAGNAESETAIQILDELGISEIRLRDTLLRTGNAQGLLNETVEMANRGWEENTELTREAELRYGTTESQLQLLRNKFNDVAITAGERLIPSFLNLMDSAEGIINSIGGVIDWFAQLDQGTVDLIFKMGLFTVAAGPILKVFASMTTATGGLIKGGGKLISWFANMGIESKIASTSTEALSASLVGSGGKATAAGKGMLGFKGILAGTAGSILAPLGITAAIAGIGYAAYKISDNIKENAAEVEKWGGTLSEETKSAINDFQELGDEAGEGTYKMALRVEEGASQAVRAYDSMAEEIAAGARQTILDTEEQFMSLPDKAREMMEDLMQGRIQRQEDIIAEASEINERITEIYANAVEENRRLTDAEMQIVEDYHKRLTELRAQTLDESAEQQAQIQSVMLEDLKNFSEEQLSNRQSYLAEEIKVVNQAYDEMIADIDDALTRGLINEYEHSAQIKQIREAQRESDKYFATEATKVWLEQGHSIEMIEEMLKEFGFTYSEIMQEMIWESAEAAGATAMVAEGLEDMSAETREANNAWNDFILDEKTGEVHTNLDEMIQEAEFGSDTWNMLEFILKEANLSTTAYETIKEALEANGTWNQLSFNQHDAPLYTNALQTAMDYMKANGDWDRLSFEEKNAVLDTNTPEQLEEILRNFGMWDRLDPAIKEMIVNSDATERAREGRTAINDWNSNKPRPIALDVTTNAHSVTRAAQRAIDQMRGKTIRVQTVHSSTGTPHNSRAFATRALGTAHHGGGLVVLGDGGQPEPFMTPKGDFGVSPSQDTMYNLPKGTKVWSSTAKFRADAMGNDLLKTFMSKLPHFATGTRDSFLEDRRFPNVFSGQNSNQGSSVTNEYNITINATGELPYNVIQRMTREIEREMKRLSNNDNLARGNMI